MSRRVVWAYGWYEERSYTVFGRVQVVGYGESPVIQWTWLEPCEEEK